MTYLQMSLKIIFDESLKEKTVKNFTSLKDQSSLDLSNPDMYFSEFEQNSNLIKEDVSCIIHRK